MMRRRIGRDVKNQGNGIFLRNIYNGISELIMSDHPEFTEDTFISSSDLNYYRKKYRKTPMEATLARFIMMTVIYFLV